MPTPSGRPRLFLLLLLTGMVVCAPARASAGTEAAPEEKLKAVEKAMQTNRDRQAQLAREADALGAELAVLRDDAVAAATAEQEHEAALAALESRLATLAEEAKRKADDLRHRRAQQAALLMALERLARNPPEALALAPGEPVDALRGGLLMGAAIPPIEAQARTLRRNIAEIDTLHADIAAAGEKHRTELAALAADQTRIADLLARKAALQRRAVQGAEQSGRNLERLAAQASDLRELIDRLEAERQRREAEEARRRAEEERRTTERRTVLAERPSIHKEGALEVTAPPPAVHDPTRPRVTRPFTEAHGRMTFPATGLLVRRYGESDDLGIASKGLTIETRPGAQVLAPFDGRVLFAGRFRGYGQILIIEHGGGYHSLLAGLGRVEQSIGQWLVAGEPVGVMGDGKPRLYLELRHDGQPINPLPWLAIRDEKVSG